MIFSNMILLISNCSNSLDLINLQEQVLLSKQIFLAISKNFLIFRLQPRIPKKFSQSQELFFLTEGKKLICLYLEIKSCN